MRAILSLWLLLTLIPAAAEVYRWTDDKGVIHYGDKPPADNAKPVQLPPLQTYSPSAPQRPTAATSAAGMPIDSVPPKIRIASPAPDETVRDAGQRLSVSVDVELKPTQGLLYFPRRNPAEQATHGVDGLPDGKCRTRRAQHHSGRGVGGWQAAESQRSGHRAHETPDRATLTATSEAGTGVPLNHRPPRGGSYLATRCG